MAVYTRVPAEELENFLEGFDIGSLVSAKGIAEGVQNSNYLIETDQDRFILTLYETKVEEGDLPFFMALIDHLADSGCPVPRAIHDREGRAINHLCGRPACLIEFKSGVSIDQPTAHDALVVGEALGQMHKALEAFDLSRDNALGLSGWQALAEQIGDGLDDIALGLKRRVADELDYLYANWPNTLPRSVIHADLFPDNVLMLHGDVTGVIDFYFACTDIRIYDLAITHSAWCFAPSGDNFNTSVSNALIRGYQGTYGLTDAEIAALPVLARGASLRFLLTRAYDWINTPEDALVTRKDPLAYLKRLDFYASAKGAQAFFNG